MRKIIGLIGQFIKIVRGTFSYSFLYFYTAKPDVNQLCCFGVEDLEPDGDNYSDINISCTVKT